MFNLTKFGSVITTLIFIVFIFSSCTENDRVKNFGGKMNIDIPSDKQFVNVTWKREELWIVTKDREINHKPEVYFFQEKSSFGIMEGKITIKEN